MAPKFELGLDFGRIQIVPKNGIFIKSVAFVALSNLLFQHMIEVLYGSAIYWFHNTPIGVHS